MLLNISKPKKSNGHHRSTVVKKNSKNKNENFSFSLSPSFATIKVNNSKKRNKKEIKKVNNSNSTSDLNKKKSKSKEKKEKQNNIMHKTYTLFKTIPIKINNNFDLFMPSNNNELETTKEFKNNYCTIVPQVLNMLNLNIYKINSTNKSQVYHPPGGGDKIQSWAKKISSGKKLAIQKKGKKIHIKRSFKHKNNINIIKTDRKKKRVYTINKMFIETNNENNFLKNGMKTARQFSSNSQNKIDEDNFLKNILFSSSGNIGYLDAKNDIIIKNKNVVIPIRKKSKKSNNNNIRNNIPLNSRCFLNTSTTKNKKKGNIVEKNHFNLRRGILGNFGNSNSILNKGPSGTEELNNNNTNTICSVKSIGHIFKTKKKSKPYNKPSLNFLINNKK